MSSKVTFKNVITRSLGQPVTPASSAVLQGDDGAQTEAAAGAEAADGAYAAGAVAGSDSEPYVAGMLGEEVLSSTSSHSLATSTYHKLRL